jgi:hypothetical protein
LGLGVDFAGVFVAGAHAIEKESVGCPRLIEDVAEEVAVIESMRYFRESIC